MGSMNRVDLGVCPLAGLRRAFPSTQERAQGCHHPWPPSSLAIIYGPKHTVSAPNLKVVMPPHLANKEPKRTLMNIAKEYETLQNQNLLSLQLTFLHTCWAVPYQAVPNDNPGPRGRKRRWDPCDQRRDQGLGLQVFPAAPGVDTAR
ncbi:unnamed protein product, partial [Mesorhabditis spiculigera]